MSSSSPSSDDEDDDDALARRCAASRARALAMASSMDGLEAFDDSSFSDSRPSGRALAIMAATLPWRDGRDHHGGRPPFSPSASASSRRRRGPSPQDDDGRRPPNAAPATVDPVARLATAKARTIIAEYGYDTRSTSLFLCV